MAEELVKWLKSSDAQWHFAEVLANQRNENINAAHNREATRLLDAVAKRKQLEERSLTAATAGASARFQDEMPMTRIPITVTILRRHPRRRAVLIDLNPDYIEQQLKRNAALPLGLTE